MSSQKGRCMQSTLTSDAFCRQVSHLRYSRSGFRALSHKFRPKSRPVKVNSRPVDSFLHPEIDMLVTMFSYAKKLLSVLGIVRPSQPISRSRHVSQFPSTLVLLAPSRNSSTLPIDLTEKFSHLRWPCMAINGCVRECVPELTS